MALHKLLQRQLSRQELNDTCCPSNLLQWQNFLKTVDKSYAEADQERYLLERSMDLSSRELLGLNQRLEEAQQIASLGYWIYDRTSEHTMWSKVVYKILGIDPTQKTPNYQEFLALVHENNRAQLQTLVKQAFENGIGYEYEMQIKNPDGQYRWYYVIAHPNVESHQLSGIIMDITKRKNAENEIAKLHEQLLLTARRSGMSEVAVTILHNVGNILNSANVSLLLIKENMGTKHIEKLFSAIEMIKQNQENLADYVTVDPKGKLIPQYLITVSKIIETEYHTILQEAENLGKQIEHIKEIVAMQQSISGVTGMPEKIFLPEVIDLAIRMSGITNNDKEITLNKNFIVTPFIMAYKSKLLQILVNLIQNAKDAVILNETELEKVIEIKLTTSNDTIDIAIEDSGIGIDPENITKIFSFGFTTKEKGHGFGLHSSALAAHEMGGNLTVDSKGCGYGSKFILSIPQDNQINRNDNYAI